MAEREGFEPPIPSRVCLISSQVHSTGLCHLSVVWGTVALCECGVAATRSRALCVAPVLPEDIAGLLEASSCPAASPEAQHANSRAFTCVRGAAGGNLLLETAPVALPAIRAWTLLTAGQKDGALRATTQRRCGAPLVKVPGGESEVRQGGSVMSRWLLEKIWSPWEIR